MDRSPTRDVGSALSAIGTFVLAAIALAAVSWFAARPYLHLVVRVARVCLHVVHIDVEVLNVALLTPLDFGILLALLVATPCLPHRIRVVAGTLGVLAIFMTDVLLLAFSVWWEVRNGPSAGGSQVEPEVRRRVFAAIPSVLAVLVWLWVIARYGRWPHTSVIGDRRGAPSRRVRGRGGSHGHATG